MKQSEAGSFRARQKEAAGLSGPLLACHSVSIANPIPKLAEKSDTVFGSLLLQWEPAQLETRLVERQVRELRPHPAVTRHRIQPSVRKVSSLAERGETAFRDPLVVTRNNYIIDGHARWHLALITKRETVNCMELQISDEEALVSLLQNQGQSHALNGFLRAVLALELEPWLKAKAKVNQQIGGQLKGSSNLTEADRIEADLPTSAVSGNANVRGRGFRSHPSRAKSELSLSQDSTVGFREDRDRRRMQFACYFPAVVRRLLKAVESNLGRQPLLTGRQA